MAKKKLLNNPYIDLKPDELLQLAIKTKDIQEKNLIEEIISDNSMLSYKYAMDYLHERFLKGEPKICKIDNNYFLLNYLKVLVCKRWEIAEPTFAKRPDTAFSYAEYLKAPFPLGEPKIAKVSTWAFRYATEILKRRWPEGEEGIAKGIENSYFYAKFLNKNFGINRFEKGEPTLMKNASYAFHYAKNILKARWIEAEPYIEQHEHFGKHYKRFLEILESKEAYINSDEELI